MSAGREPEWDLCLGQVVAAGVSLIVGVLLGLGRLYLPALIFLAVAVGFYAISVQSASMAASADVRAASRRPLHPIRFTRTLLRLRHSHRLVASILTRSPIDRSRGPMRLAIALSTGAAFGLSTAALIGRFYPTIYATSDITPWVSPAGPFRVTVVSPSGQPISGARVRVDGRYLYSNDDGSVDIPKIYNNLTTIAIEAPGYEGRELSLINLPPTIWLNEDSPWYCRDHGFSLERTCREHLGDAGYSVRQDDEAICALLRRACESTGVEYHCRYARGCRERCQNVILAIERRDCEHTWCEPLEEACKPQEDWTDYDCRNANSCVWQCEDADAGAEDQRRCLSRCNEKQLICSSRIAAANCLQTSFMCADTCYLRCAESTGCRACAATCSDLNRICEVQARHRECLGDPSWCVRRCREYFVEAGTATQQDCEASCAELRANCGSSTDGGNPM